MPRTRVKLTAPRYRKRHSGGSLPIDPQRSRYTGILSRCRHSTGAEANSENRADQPQYCIDI